MKQSGTAVAGALFLLLGCPGCGWHLVGRGTSLDPRVRVIAIPAFENETDYDELQQRLTDAVVNAFVRRGRYKIVSDPGQADAVLEGTIKSFTVRNTQLDDQGRAIRAEATITVALRFRNRLADRVTWSNDAFLFRKEYDIPSTSSDYLEQEILAIEDLAQDFATSVVSTILEGF